MFAATIMTITAMAMLKVNSRSSTKGGSGSTIMARTSRTAIGAPSAAMTPARGPSRACSLATKGFMRRRWRKESPVTDVFFAAGPKT